MISYQNPLTIIAPVKLSELSKLRNLLKGIQYPDVEANMLVPFYKMRSIHFARFVVIDCEKDRFPVQLAFSTNYDGDEKTHVSELISIAKDGLKQIYRCCEGFAGNLHGYWADHKVSVNAFYNGHPGISVNQIIQENALRSAIADYLNQLYLNGTFNHLSAIQIKNMVSSFIRKNDDFEWAIRDQGLSYFQRFIFQRKTFIAELIKIFGILLLVGFSIFEICKLLKISVKAVFFILFVSFGAGFLSLKRKLNQLENIDVVNIEAPSSGHLQELLHAENYQVQNQLTHLVEIKPGYFRLNLLKFVLSFINILAKTYFNRGELGSIPSIHFARWAIIDKDKRLIFFSNYDGSWESYLSDFVDKAAVGLTSVWSNTKNFPKSRNLLQEGARDEQQFKEWARHLQITTQVWYSAYKTLSVQNINNNALIRSGLFRKMDEIQAQAWLDRIFYYKR